MEFENLMIDIETLGQNSNSVICSIAAVPFDLATGKTGKPFQRNISVGSCLSIGLKIDGATLAWWERQDKQIFKSVISGEEHIKHVLQTFSVFIAMNLQNNVKVWGNGARFDLGLLTDAYVASGCVLPWNFGNERDVRTLLSLYPQAKQEVPKPVNAHLPLEDCMYQIAYCTRVYQTLNIPLWKQ